MDDQTILAELRGMREEQRNDHDSLVTSVNQGFKEVAATYAAHELKDQARFADISAQIAPLAATHANYKWAVRSVFALVGTAAVDFLFNHLPKLFASVK
jgi:hypothetical protein